MKNLRIKIPARGARRTVALGGITELSICGTGKLAYLWVGIDGNFVTYRDNSAELRHWLRRALERMEAER